MAEDLLWFGFGVIYCDKKEEEDITVTFALILNVNAS